MNKSFRFFSIPDILHRGRSLFVVSVLILLITGCVVNIPKTFYRPAAPGGTVVRAMQPRTTSVILFERQDVIVGVNTTYDYKNQLYVSISFEIPNDKVVQLLENTVEVSVASKEMRKSKLSGRIWTGAGRTKDFPLKTPMVGRDKGWSLGTAKGYGNTKYAAFFFNALLFTAPEAETFEIKIPRFLVNNIESVLPIIEFTLDSENLWTSLP